MFRINRSSLLSRILSLSQSGSVLITGSPGSGKSWLIAQAVRAYVAEKRPHLPIVAEDYPVNSLDQLRAALGFKSEVLTFLASLPGDPVLIIDGLDSLRSDPSQRVFRELIRKLPHEAPRCSVVASIRTFDLRQSEEFQSVFFSSSSRSQAKTFHEIVLPSFSDEEIADVSRQLPAIEPLLRRAEGEFLELLRNPFNLMLAAELVTGGTPTSEIAPLRSQVQLLSKYWAWRVDTPSDHVARNVLLREMTRLMVSGNTLSVPEAEIDTYRFADSFSHLLSDEVVRKSVTNRVSFAHNILFDYAAARLLLDEKTVVRFIDENPNRTIFFRPSLAYFFHYLWLRDRTLFWNTAYLFFASETLPERARIIPAVTIYEAAEKIEDLEPILLASSPTQIQGIAGTLRAVQALGGLQSAHRRKLWLDVLARLARNPAMLFVNEYAALLNVADESKTASEATAIFAAATEFLRWIWKLESDHNRRQAVSLAHFGANRVLPLILKNYGVNPEDARKIVFEVLARYGTPTAARNEALRLANGIRNIIQHDPEAAAEVYRRTFAYKETSQEPTELGGGAALSLRSTRAQDFSTSLYILQTAFPAFIDLNAEQAARAAIDAVNEEIRREKELKPIIEGAPLAAFDFDFQGKRVTYRADYSEIWDSGSHEYISLNLLNTTLNHISETLSADRESATRLFQVVVTHATFAVVWKRLLLIATTKLSAWYPLLRELFFAPEFLSAPETTIQVGELLKSLYTKNIVSAEDGRTIEQAILAIADAKVILRYEKPESIRDRLLTNIPQGKLASTEAMDLADRLKEQKVRENKPYFSTSFFQKAFDTEDWLKEKGVDTAKKENAAVLAALGPLQEFDTKYLNEVPSAGACVQIEPTLTNIQTLVAELKPDEELAATARGLLCGAAESVLKNPALSANEAVFLHCRQIALDGARDPVPQFNPKYHLPFEMPGWGGGQARIEAAQALSHCLWNWGPDPEIVSALEHLSRDGVPAVRYQVAAGILGFWKHKALSEFWSMLEQMFSKEETPGVLIALANSAGQIAVNDPGRVARLLSAAIGRSVLRTERSELSRTFVQVLVGLYVVKSNPEANNQLLEFEADPVQFEREIAEGIHVASAYLASHPKNDKEVRFRGRELMIRALISTYRSLEILETTPELQDPNSFRKLLRIIEAVAMRVYHTLDISPYRPDGASGMEQSTREGLYWELKPVLEFLTVRRSLKGTHYLAPHTAHELIQSLNACLSFDPAPIVQFAAAACRASKVMSYQFEPDSIEEIVKLVEHVLADHRDILRDPPIAADVGEMLDIFVSAGWPQAMNLTFRLDDAIR